MNLSDVKDQTTLEQIVEYWIQQDLKWLAILGLIETNDIDLNDEFHANWIDD